MSPAGAGAWSERCAFGCGVQLGHERGMRAVGSLPYRQAQPAAGGPARGDFALLAPHLKDVVLEQGMVLQEQGEPIDQVYFPHDGIISLLAVMRQGDAIETATIGYEGAVGSFAGLGSAARTRAPSSRSREPPRASRPRIFARPSRTATPSARSSSLRRDVAHPGPADRGLQRAARGGGAPEPLAAPGRATASTATRSRSPTNSCRRCSACAAPP